MKTFPAEEVAKHDQEGDAWIVIDDEVYDVSKFAALHPGGRAILQNEAGTDASALFRRYHAPAVLQKYRN